MVLSHSRMLPRLLAAFLFLTFVSISSADDADQTCAAGSTPGECIAPPESNGGASVATAAVTTPAIDTRTYPECGLYLAESTIPGAGVGIFSAVEKRPGDAIGSGDVCIPNIDITANNPQPMFNPFNAYYWSGQTMGMSRESLSTDIEAYCPGLDCAINCNLALINTHRSWPIYDYGKLHRGKDPGAGAFTPYHNGTTHASRYIPAGGELFKFYGNGYFESRPKVFGYDFPLLHNYQDAEALIRNMTAMNLPAEIQQDLYESVVLAFQDVFTSRIMRAFPDSVTGAVVAAEQEIAVLHQPNATRSIAWLQEYGRCMDNMSPQFSNLFQAGRGAFATRRLTEGQVITTSPLLHLPFSSFVEMYDFEDYVDDATGKVLRRAMNVSGHQVLTNYCYGHVKSSMVLCPYGNGINYINHNQTLANVRIRWAEGFDIVHNQTLVENGTVNELMWNYKPQLALDYIALRDIKPGEELYLDYGNMWEAAWQRHVANWKPVRGADKYIAGLDINLQHGTVPIRTMNEQATNPYPEHLLIRAHRVLRDIAYVKEGQFQWTLLDFGYEARILERYVTANEHYYTLEIGIPSEAVIQADEKSDGAFSNKEADLTWYLREKVPRYAVAFFDKHGYTDIHLPNAFRHILGIPDDIFPTKWKNAAGGELTIKPDSIAGDEADTATAAGDKLSATPPAKNK